MATDHICLAKFVLRDRLVKVEVCVVQEQNHDR